MMARQLFDQLSFEGIITPELRRDELWPSLVVIHLTGLIYVVMISNHSIWERAHPKT
jgi:hypothetical protein